MVKFLEFLRTSSAGHLAVVLIRGDCVYMFGWALKLCICIKSLQFWENESYDHIKKVSIIKHMVYHLFWDDFYRWKLICHCLLTLQRSFAILEINLLAILEEISNKKSFFFSPVHYYSAPSLHWAQINSVKTHQWM